ncbi:putative oligopeptide ABC transporter, permease protein AppC [[Eubacterium] yurii subsp. margaretiae ATCC 43715]|nr:putative oligopeptide ABC transporter, permease protein AppC [[Eubacterium] yurii subsp. margaretiae ATCC 43715]
MNDLSKQKSKMRSAMAKRSLNKMISNKLGMIGFIVVVVMSLMSILAPVLTNIDPTVTDMANINKAPGGLHILGTDSIGRDLFSRLLYGGRISISIGIISALTTSFIGTVFGLIAGYFRGMVDSLLVRLSEVIQTVPMIILVMVLVTIIGPGVRNMVLVFSLTGWMTVFRIVRNEVLRLREETYVEVNRAFGISNSKIMFSQILPNTLSPIIVATTINVAFFILSETELSFLGLGVPTNISTWGTIINGAKSLSVIENQWWLWIIPGAVISLFIMSINFFGDALRDVLDPKN